jgi:ATP-dependent exoDNAse (exonuclease V) alpha subunit
LRTDGPCRETPVRIHGLEAKTVHRLLAFDPTVLAFKRNEEEPLDLDLLVIDESSMMSSS